MREMSGSSQVGSDLRKMAVAVCLIALLWQPPSAAAGGLKDVVKDLYGGDGILLSPSVSVTHFADFNASSLQGLDNLSTAVTSSLGVFAFNSTVTGFTFDIERGVPVRTTESLGPLLAERASTLGAKKLDIAVSYSRIEFKRFEGTRLEDLSLTFDHGDTNGDGVLTAFELDKIRVDLDLEIQQDVLALFATYGLTSIWDVGIVVPIIHSRARANANATIIRNFPGSQLVHQFGPDGDSPTSTIDREKTGIGDIILRTKYNFLRKQAVWPDLAVVGQVKLPTGDEDDLLGTGETNFLALLVASRSFAKLTPHLNLGYELTTDREQNNFRYVAGLDAQAHPRVTVALDVLGRREPSGDGIGDHTVDLAFGIKWNAYRSFLFNANVQVPLNRGEGLRPDVIWTLGASLTF